MLLLAGFAFVAALAASAAEPWTLSAAITEGLARSPDTHIARARVEAAKAMLTQAAFADWPQVSLKGSYLQTDNPMMAFGSILGQRAFRQSINFNRPGQADNFNLTAAVGYNIYSGGRATAGKAAARAGAEAAERDEEAAQAQLASEITRAYFQISQAQEGLRALGAAVAAYVESLRACRLREEAGQVLRSELLNLEVQLAQTREQYLGMKHSVALAGKYFLFLLGRDGHEITVVMLAPDDKTAALVAPEKPLSPANRAERFAMQRRVAAAEAMVKVARGARRPTVNAFASYQHDQGWRLDGDSRSWTAGLQAEIAIFDGNLTRGRIRQAEAELAQSQEGLRKLDLALSLQLAQAALAHELALEQLAVTDALVAQADEAARISRERFAAGSLLSAELISVETRLAESRMRRAQAETNAQITIAELRLAAGLPLFSQVK